jgi:hypothetical protein
MLYLLPLAGPRETHSYIISLSLSLSHTHPHTHKHTQGDRGRDRDVVRKANFLQILEDHLIKIHRGAGLDSSTESVPVSSTHLFCCCNPPSISTGRVMEAIRCVWGCVPTHLTSWTGGLHILVIHNMFFFEEEGFTRARPCTDKPRIAKRDAPEPGHQQVTRPLEQLQHGHLRVVHGFDVRRPSSSIHTSAHIFDNSSVRRTK